MFSVGLYMLGLVAIVAIVTTVFHFIDLQNRPGRRGQL